MKKEFVCIVCPMGCRMNVEVKDGEVCVHGNSCAKGGEYAKNECTNPKRVVTTTVRCEDGGVVAVKTDRAVSKESIKACMEIINRQILCLPISVGDIIIKDVFGANVIATQNRM